MAKKLTGILLAIILCLLIILAQAEGLLPGMDDLFGTAMPSVSLSVGKTPDNRQVAENKIHEFYDDFSEEDYISFGRYLAGIGAAIDNYSIEDGVITATISARNAYMTFSYNWGKKTAEVEYPAGTRNETRQETITEHDSILPPIGGVMPSIQFAINRKPDQQTTDDKGITQLYSEFNDDDYSAVSGYLAETGASIKTSTIDKGILTAQIYLNGCSIAFEYNWNTQTATVIYPDGTTPEEKRWNTISGSGYLLPDITNIGKELPSISRAIHRVPSASETMPDGSLKETYNDFSDGEYKTFSNYLEETGCILDDYHTEGDGIIIINLHNVSGSFSLTYDAYNHVCSTIYPKETRVESIWSPTPTPEPTATPEPTPKKLDAKYNREQCWKIAQQYFENLRWENPASVTIYNHTSELSYMGDTFVYTFMIDYSAQNRIGGTTRGYYFISVDIVTGSIIQAFGSN